jgi:hypothetical protein
VATQPRADVAMSSESTPGAVLDRLCEVAFVAARRNAWADLRRGHDDPQPISDLRAAVLAVLPALADEMEKLRQERIENMHTGNYVPGWCEAADFVRSLAAPADESKP